jgi:hypothetical protein
MEAGYGAEQFLVVGEPGQNARIVKLSSTDGAGGGRITP